MLVRILTSLLSKAATGIRILILFLFSTAAMAQYKAGLFTRSQEDLPAEAKKGLSRGQRLKVSEEAIREIYIKEPESIAVEIPLPGSSSKTFVYYKTRVVSDDFKVSTSDGKEFRGKKFTGVHYQVRPGNQTEKVAALSFTENEVMGIFSDEKTNWNIGLLPKGKGDYIVFAEKDLMVNSGFSCGTPDIDPELMHPGTSQRGGSDKSVQSSGTCKVVKMYFECDYKMYQDNGSSTSATSSKITSMFSMVQQLFSNEQISVELDQVYVWTSTDPYATLSPSNTVLSSFTTNRQAITQKLGHLVSTRPASMGGIAWLDVVCNPAFGMYKFGFSNIYNTFSAVPTYSWSVYCMTHEIGHNFGSNHTHWCGWIGGAIDNCYTSEPANGSSCAAGPAVTNGGTMMSYCHLTSQGINFTKGFGTQPGAKIRSGFSCITGSPVPVFSLSASRSLCAGENLALSANSTTSGAVFAWTGPNGFSSSLQNPVISSATSAAGGTYSCSVTAAGCTSSPKTVNVIVNSPGLPPVSEGFTTANFPPAGWRISNPNGDVTWVRNTSVGGFGTSTNSMAIDNYNLPFTNGKKDTIFLPVVNLSGQTGASMVFDVAHAWNGTSHDTLCVLVSSNCGKSFQRLYKKSGSALSTAPSTFNQFIPTATQWRKETINLSAFDGQPQVQVAFAVYSGASNFIYIDNIGVTATASGSTSISLNALSQSSFCPGQTFSVAFTPAGSFNAGNSFSVELSNASGSFSSPVVIGSGASSPVSVTIPAATASGTGYKIRVTASAPSTTSASSSALTVAPLVVSAGADQTVCSNGNAISLSASPAGGTWSGSGVSASGLFTPSAALVGNQTLTYSVSTGACSGSDQVVVTVNSLPAVNAGADQSTCSLASPFALSGFSPAGGTWSGNGVSSGGTFTPSGTLIGSNTLTYSYSLNGCTNSDSRVVTVSASVTVSAGASQSICSNAAPRTLTGTPAGGTWSGNGVSSSGLFTPSSSLVGDNLLTYSVSGACAGNAQTTISVTAAPVVSAGVPASFCLNDPAVPITQGSPAGGSWSGTGVSGGNFNPASAGTGTFTLTYSASSGSCSSTSSVQFTVNPNPVVAMPAAQSFCSNGPAFSLSASPAGGNWSGPGINAAGLFTPSASLTGINSLIYQLSVNGCQGSGVSIVTVKAVPQANAGTDRNVLVTDADFNLAGTPGGGTWTGSGVSASGLFSPQNTGAGTYTLTYAVTENGCTGADQVQIVVNPVAAVNAGNDQSVCSTAPAVQLSGIPSGGTWSGNGVSASGLFTPSAALIGNQILTYSVAGAGSDQVSITVIAQPSVSAGADQGICASASDFTLTGTPAGGTWTGNGISSSGLVSVASLSNGANSFTYSVTVLGCSSQDAVVISKVVPPAVNAGINQSLCLNASALQLSASPAGGSWTGNGVSSAGVFSPALAGTGVVTLTYTVSGSFPGCDGSDQMNITVKPLPQVAAGADRSTCANASPILLTASPAGGSWSGSGITSAGLFTPAASLTGQQSLVYSATLNGCTASDTLMVTVNPVPSVNAGPDKNICTGSPAFSLSGFSPSGGVWSGPAFLSASGQCTSPFASGTYALTYTVTQNGCTGSDQLQLQVSPAPAVNAGSNRSICANAPDLTLAGFSPAGGTWSGPGVSPQGVFSPSVSLVGTQTLTYTVISGGCSGTDQLTITVKAIPSVTAGPAESTCASAARFKLSGFSPRGGVFSGPGVVLDSLYQPAVSLVGNQTLTYTVTKNGCSNSSQKVVTVNPPNSLSPAASNPAVLCAGGSPVALICSPSGGTWKGNGVSPSGVFTPSAPLVGNRTLYYRLDQGGCRDSVAVELQVQALPVVNAGNDISACSAGSPVQISGFSPAGGTWSGPGVSASGVFSPAAAGPGNAILTYTVTENGCSASDQLQIAVSSSPPVNAGADKTICQNSEAIQFSASPIGGTWSGSGVSASGLFSPAGMSGPVSLTYTLNQNGCTGSDQVQITIGPALSVNAGVNQSICSNDLPFSLSGFSPSGGSWTGNGVSPGGLFNPESVPAGSQILVYRITQANCIVSDQKVVEVKAAPQVSAGADRNLCNNDPNPQLTGFSPAGGSWSGTVVSASGQVQVSQAGSYLLTYTASNNGCSASDQMQLTIVAAPQVEAGPNQSICGLVPAFGLQGNSPSGGSWSGNGVSSSGQFTPAASMLGNTVVLVYSLTQNGCSAADSTRIQVLDIPSQIALSSPSDTACEGELLSLSLSAGGNTPGFLYQWKKNGTAIPGANAPVYAASSGGSYLAVVSLASCSVTSQSKSLVFNPLPETPVITQSGMQLSSSAAAGNQWKRNGQDIAGATQQTFTVTQSGIYTVVVSNQNCTSGPSNAIAIDLTGVEEMFLQAADWKLYPNPVKDRLFLSCSSCEGKNYSFLLMDVTGRTLKTFRGKMPSEKDEMLDVSALPAGVYWLKSDLKGLAFTRKILLQ